MQVTSNSRLEISDSLRHKLLEFRRRVWMIKMIEAFAGVLIGVLVGYLLTYGLDRLFDTPRAIRGVIFAAAVVTCGLIPLALERWVWQRRRLDQLARLLSHNHPDIGDRLLGIIELAENESEQTRSPALVEAAIVQVSEEAEHRDFRDGVPHPRHVRRSWAAGLLAVAALLLLVLTTAAARNAWARFLAPWSPTPRYTFAAIEPLPDRMVVAHGEPFIVPVQLADSTEWHPPRAEAGLAGHGSVVASLTSDGAYHFDLPGQIAPGRLSVKVGDFSGEMEIEPVLRPELNELHADIELPGYLGRDKPVEKDIRGGSLTAVLGSRATFTATISRELATARVNDHERSPQGKQFSTEPVSVGEPRELQLNWEDQFGLSGQEPFVLTIAGAPDEPPSLICENLPRRRVLLDSEVLTFQVRARDDFGVKRVGIEWQGVDTTLSDPAHGERIIGAGGSEAELLDLAATFSATQWEIAPQPIAVRVFVEDFLPGRERVYSPTCLFDVLNAEEHAIWVTAQLSRWHRMSLEVRDRELQLFEINKELRNLSAEEIDRPETRRRIETQAAAERSNGRRLSHLVNAGDELLTQAMRNPEIGVGHLETWAGMMQILRDIAGNRMPSVADLLKQASKAPTVAQNTPSNRGPKAGQNRLNQSGGDPKKGDGKKKPPTAIPTISDIESSHNPPKPGEPKPPSEGKSKQPRLTLPTTMLAGNSSSKPKSPPAAKKTDEAVREQQDLLAEFEKVADELNRVLANLEGSTLVKRLKAASRKQQKVAMKLGSVVTDTFGVNDRTKAAEAETFKQLSTVESNSSETVSYIMDDMAAYFDRSRFMRFKVVLDDMREQDVTAALRNLSDDVRTENGLSISQAEYWSETLDRWAEDLVDVTKCGACPGGKSKDSLPPSIVLEVLQILEGEINLREQTRVAEQARPAISPEEHTETGDKLSETQDVLRERIDKVIGRILELPDAKTHFGKEIALLRSVSPVMAEATAILATPDTGSAAIAAETEAIELLLKSKRINPGGGGGGSDPGGGGGGDTVDSALALVGSGVNEKAVSEDHETSQATGTSGPVLPEEFRAGLDEYFNRLDQPGQ